MPERGPTGRFVGRPARRSMPPQVCPCGKPCKKNCKICPECAGDSAQKARMQYQLALRRFQEKVEREAEAETANLKKAESLPPVVAESIINRWLREG